MRRDELSIAGLSAMADVVEINDLESLQHYRMAWNALLDETPRASFFQTFDWFEQFWRHFGHVRRMRILVARSSGAIIGIVPLCVQRESFRVGSLRVLTYPLADWGAWYAPLGPNQAATMYLAASHLSRTPRDWDLLDLRWTDAHPVEHPAVGPALQAAGLPCIRRPYQTNSVIQMDSSWDEYLASKSRKIRHEIRRRMNLGERVDRRIEFVRHRPQRAACGDGRPRWDLFDACQRIAGRSWQATSVDGNTLSDGDVAGFLRHCHAAAARLGMVDMTMLTVDDQPAAFGYNYHYKQTLIGLRMGYDPDYASLGVGATLLATAIRDSFRRGDAALELGAGENRFKLEYRNLVELSYQFTHYPAAWRSQSLRLTHWLRNARA